VGRGKGKGKPRPTWNLPDDSRQNKPIKPIHLPLRISFQHIAAGDNHCLSFCKRDDVKEAMDCLRMLTSMTWQQIIEQGGKPGSKVGLGYTPYSDNDMSGVRRPATLSPDIQIGGIRASRGFRVFGAHKDSVFYVLWFDPNHEIVEG
jgi:hypothetical protein